MQTFLFIVCPQTTFLLALSYLSFAVLLFLYHLLLFIAVFWNVFLP